jgi:hypothetical protein
MLLRRPGEPDRSAATASVRQGADLAAVRRFASRRRERGVQFFKRR